MIKIVTMIVNAVYNFSIYVLIVLGIVGVLYEIVGYGKFQMIFATLGIENGFKFIWILGTIVIGLLVLTWIVKYKIFVH